MIKSNGGGARTVRWAMDGVDLVGELGVMMMMMMAMMMVMIMMMMMMTTMMMISDDEEEEEVFIALHRSSGGPDLTW